MNKKLQILTIFLLLQAPLFCADPTEQLEDSIASILRKYLLTVTEVTVANTRCQDAYEAAKIHLHETGQIGFEPDALTINLETFDLVYSTPEDPTNIYSLSSDPDEIESENYTIEIYNKEKIAFKTATEKLKRTVKAFRTLASHGYIKVNPEALPNNLRTIFLIKFNKPNPNPSRSWFASSTITEWLTPEKYLQALAEQEAARAEAARIEQEAIAIALRIQESTQRAQQQAAAIQSEAILNGDLDEDFFAEGTRRAQAESQRAREQAAKKKKSWFSWF